MKNFLKSNNYMASGKVNIKALIIGAAIVFGYSITQAAPCPVGEDFVSCVKAKTAQVLNLATTVRMGDIVQEVPEVFNIPSEFHHQGVMHTGIFRIFIDGQPRLLKIVLQDKIEYYDSSFFYHIDDAEILEQVSGMVLASEVGGPQIYQAGKFISEDNRTGFYIVMEEFFHGQQDTATLKGLFYAKDFEAKNKLLDRIGLLQIKKMAFLLTRALERNIKIGSDLDMIFGQDDLAWIDTGDWQFFTKDFKFNTEAIFNFIEFIKTLRQLRDGLAAQLFYELRAQISQSAIWSLTEKQQIWENFKAALSRWGWSLTDTEKQSQILQVEIEPAPIWCRDFLK